MTSAQDCLQQRRRSFGFFSRPTVLQELTNVSPTNGSSDYVSLPLPKPRPKSMIFTTTTTVDGGITQEISATVSTNSLPSPRGKVLVKPRPRSVFGSLKSRDTRYTESSRSSSTESSRDGNGTDVADLNSTIIYSGEALSTGGLLRRKKEYLVLTTRELLRFKSQQKAHEQMGTPYVPIAPRNVGNRAASFSSISDAQASENLITPLTHVIAVYKPDLVDPGSCTLQLDHVDEYGTPSSTILQLSSLEDTHMWLQLLRSTAISARETYPVPSIGQKTMAHIAQRLDAEKDYVPEQFFQVYRIVQRAGSKSHYRSSSDDLQKMYSTICYLAIGPHKIHIIPIPKSPTNRSTGSLLPVGGASVSFGLLNLSDIAMSTTDDSFAIAYRFPCQAETRLLLASAQSADIIQSIRRVAEFLRPQWLIQPFNMTIPEELRDEPLTPEEIGTRDDYNFIDRTLAAYCAAYDIDASNICYGINTEAEDSPQFVLYPPSHSRRKNYSDLELLAVLRSLRWNEAFSSISFRGISLDPLMKITEKHGNEYEPNATRSGRPVKLKTSDSHRPLLVAELRALALCSTKLRSLDFYECIAKQKRRSSMEFRNDESEGCGVVEAIMPLCRRGYTNVDWFNFGGIELAESDLDWLVDAAASKLAHFRGFELARCGLTERMANLFLAALIAHENTLEVLDLSGNPGRFHAPSLNNAMCYFPYLRKLNLSKLLRTSGADPLLTPEVLLRWRLQELDLSETTLNRESVDAVSTYLASSQSDALHRLVLTQTGINAGDVAVFMYSMSRQPGKARDMHMYIGQNPLNIYHSELVDAIRAGVTPTHLTMRMVDYPKEDMFRELLKGLAVNKTILYVDLSKVSLPYEAGSETCAALGELFARNTTLKELDLSGEQAVLETARLGGGINNALGRLAENRTLETLKIELQTLGTSGAMVLSKMLLQNSTLKRLYCDMNKIYLQGFSSIVNSLEYNTSLIYFPVMERDRAEQVKLFRDSIAQTETNAGDHPPPKSALKRDGSFKKNKAEKRVSILDHGRHKLRPSLGRQLSTVGEDKPKPTVSTLASPSSTDPMMLLRMLDEKWDAETARLLGFLERNSQLEEERSKLPTQLPLSVSLKD